MYDVLYRMYDCIDVIHLRFNKALHCMYRTIYPTVARPGHIILIARCLINEIRRSFCLHGVRILNVIVNQTRGPITLIKQTREPIMLKNHVNQFH